MNRGVPRIVRKQDYFKPMLRALAEFNVEFEIALPTGRGHPILRFHNGVHGVRIALPTTPSGGSRARIYVPSEIRRVMRNGMVAGDRA